MKYFLEQIVVAQNGDGPNWINIVPIVLIAIFYAIGSILKARANKAEEQKGQEQLRGKPGFKPAESRGVARRTYKKTAYPQAQRKPERAVQRRARPQIQPSGRKPARPQPIAEKFAAKKEPAEQLGTLESLEVSKLPRPTPELEELPEFTGKAVKGLEDRPLISKKIPRTEAALEYLLDVDDPESLRRAILHYEILGKPLSLRRPGEQIIGL